MSHEQIEQKKTKNTLSTAIKIMSEHIFESIACNWINGHSLVFSFELKNVLGENGNDKQNLWTIFNDDKSIWSMSLHGVCVKYVNVRACVRYEIIFFFSRQTKKSINLILMRN